MNRTVLVTGASRGIGRAIASAFAAEGDRLIITCSRSEQDEWVNASYTNNPKEPQKLIHKTIPGILVRSKSEALIINALFEHKIPFRYECLLQIQNVPNNTLHL